MATCRLPGTVSVSNSRRPSVKVLRLEAQPGDGRFAAAIPKHQRQPTRRRGAAQALRPVPGVAPGRLAPIGGRSSDSGPRSIRDPSTTEGQGRSPLRGAVGGDRRRQCRACLAPRWLGACGLCTDDAAHRAGCRVLSSYDRSSWRPSGVIALRVGLSATFDRFNDLPIHSISPASSRPRASHPREFLDL